MDALNAWRAFLANDLAGAIPAGLSELHPCSVGYARRTRLLHGAYCTGLIARGLLHGAYCTGLIARGLLHWG